MVLPADEFKADGVRMIWHQLSRETSGRTGEKNCQMLTGCKAVVPWAKAADLKVQTRTQSLFTAGCIKKLGRRVKLKIEGDARIFGSSWHTAVVVDAMLSTAQSFGA